jgi:hypothetical protein
LAKQTDREKERENQHPKQLVHAIPLTLIFVAST